MNAVFPSLLLNRGLAPTVADFLLHWGERQPDEPCLRFLSLGGETAEISYGALAARVTSWAAAIAGRTRPDDRVLLLFPAGLDFPAAFLACQLAGTVPVPTFPPHPREDGERLRLLVEDCGASLILAATEILPLAERLGLPAPLLDPAGFRATGLGPARRTGLAFLQYTSGSTGRPKGVMIDHQALLANAAMIADRFGVRSDTHSVSWLPNYHDMGLIGTVLVPILAGICTNLMAPTSFLRDPLAWLRAVSTYRVDISGGPNFAYELCAQRLASRDIEEVRDIDLSSWQLAFVGAEMVRPQTLAAFAAAAAPLGFRPDVFQPCYGLAECTLFVDAVKDYPARLWRRFSAPALSLGEARPAQDHEEATTLVMSGTLRMPGDSSLKIVDQASGLALPDGRVGEIWIAGPHVARGYWRRPEETEAAFNNRLADDPATWFRSRDLGFIQDGRLFVTGRADDAMVVNGRNLFAEDIEQTVGSAHPDLPLWRTAVFDAGIPGRPAIVALQEVAREGRSSLDVQGVISAIRAATSRRHGLRLEDVVLLKPGGLPVTSSGKVRRKTCRDLYRQGQLERFVPPRQEPVPADPQEGETTALAVLVSELIGAKSTEIDLSLSPTALGLDSLQLVQLQLLIETRLGRHLPPDILFGDTPLAQLDRIEPSARPHGAYWGDAALAAAVRPAPGTPGDGALLITGVTGLVGGEVLKALLANGKSGLVCPIRAAGDGDAWRRLEERLGGPADRERIQAFAADLAHPDLGLAEEGYATLAGAVGTIVHCAAELDFLKPYDSLKSANVEPLRSLLGLAAGGRAKRLLHVSSISAIESPLLAGQRLGESQPVDFPETLANGYAQSKWVAERMAWNAVERGFAVDVLRAGWIVDGSEFVDRFIAACRYLGAVPDGGHGWHFIGSDQVVGAILLALDEPARPGEHRVRNLGDGKPLPSRRLVAPMRRAGAKVSLLPMEEWCRRLLAAAGDRANPLFAFTPLFRADAGGRPPIQAYLEGALPVMDVRRTLRWLKRGGVPQGSFDLAAKLEDLLGQEPAS